MSAAFILSDLVLCAAQAALVALPGREASSWMVRLGGRWWALVLPGSIGVVVVAIDVSADSARTLTWLALLTTPPLAALALAWGLRGARRRAALVVLPVLALAGVTPDAFAGRAAALVLTALACVTLARLLAAVAPLAWLKAGIVAMAVIDAVLVFSHTLQAPNAVLNAAVPAAGLPRFQLASFGDAVMGYGDLFVAAVLGAVLAAEGARKGWAAWATLGCAVLFDALFLVTSELPATVPVALALVLVEVARRRSLRPMRPPAARPAARLAHPV